MASRIARVSLLVTKLALVIATLVTFVLAERLRASRTDVATLLSMVGWGGFVVLFFVWLWERPGPVAGLRALGRAAVLAVVCGAVLYVYHMRSRILEAGVDVDDVYTYIGLRWFTELHNPITFAGGTVSYPQLPMTLFTHLPALAIGFDRLGPFAVHLGMMVEIALVLAVLTAALAPAPSMTMQMAIVALAAAIFSNRMLVLIYNLPGYGIPAVCLGAIFLVVVEERALASPLRVVGGLLTLSLLHHYPGFFIALPLVVAWLIMGKEPLRRMSSFARENLPLLLALAILAITLFINPNLLLQRVIDVTLQSRPFEMNSWAGKLKQTWPYLVTSYPADLKRFFFLGDQGSWHRLGDLPAIGTVLALITLLNWVVSAATFRRRWLRYVLYLVGFASFLAVLSALQHLVTDFSDRRDFTLIIALMVAGFTLLFRMPGLGRFGRAAVCAYAVGLSVYNYVDLGALHGRHYPPDHPYISQRTMESLHGFMKRGSGARLGTARLYPVLDRFFPLLDLYVKDAGTHGVVIRPIPVEDFCGNPEGEIEKALGGSCEAAVIALDRMRCPEALRPRLAALGWVHPDGPGTVALYRYESACGREAGDLAARGKPSVVEIAP